MVELKIDFHFVPTTSSRAFLLLVLVCDHFEHLEHVEVNILISLDHLATIQSLSILAIELSELFFKLVLSWLLTQTEVRLYSSSFLQLLQVQLVKGKLQFRVL